MYLTTNLRYFLSLALIVDSKDSIDVDTYTD